MHNALDDLKRSGNVFGWGFYFLLISLGSPHVRPMGHTCGEPNEIELTASHGLLLPPLSRPENANCKDGKVYLIGHGASDPLGWESWMQGSEASNTMPLPPRSLLAAPWQQACPLPCKTHLRVIVRPSHMGPVSN